jgi:hypothetical protein
MSDNKQTKKEYAFLKVTMGCDPEFFFRKADAVVGAEAVLPKEGLVSDGKIIIDGVQAEINPLPSFCRELLKNNIRSCLYTLARHIECTGIEVDMSRVVRLKNRDMAKLSDDSKKFGCAPSKNDDGEGKIGVDAAKYRYRSAGGHIHIGYFENLADKLECGDIDETYYNLCTDINAAIANPSVTVPLLDLIVGNTLVLIDRDKGNIERRKVYGKAGEYRTPKHGLEYRTPSNFWLTSYPMMSLAFGLTRTAVLLAGQSNKMGRPDYVADLMALVPREDVKEAINTNSYTKALRNFKKIKAYLCEVSTKDNYASIHAENVDKFLEFAARVNKDGITKFFPTDPFYHWTNSVLEYGGGWESFINNVKM